MKIEIKNKINFKFVNNNTNIFVFDNSNYFKHIKNCYELLISGKNENDYYKITYQEKDIFYDKTNWKILFFQILLILKKISLHQQKEYFEIC
ncbi:hypothetical protein M1771_06680 [Spiroplasma citri]|uniref:Plectrovirus-related protein n=1 Tax=Spiroplasma citri TaxID=2133 RepID=A0AAX3SWU7_SPICI|nr:hypothetical protein [Spiroplasma citri]WFG95794.1 hypothetical protein M0C40_06745 [Spiroplasma citri]WFG99676.1 hypothetical protein M1771_06680 [Spiroplasma citri]